MRNYFSPDIEEVKKYFTQIDDFKSWLYLGADTNHKELFGVIKEYLGVNLLFIIVINKNFPNVKPDIYFLNGYDCFRDIPHLMPSDAICYVDEEGLLMDEDNPTGIIRDSFRKALDTLIKSLKGESKDDYLKEFQYYWGDSNSIEATSFIRDLKAPKIVLWLIASNGRSFIFESEEQAQWYSSKFAVNLEEWESRKILYLPLTSSKDISFKNQWTIDTLKNVIFRNIGLKNRLNRYLRTDVTLPVYITIPTENNSSVHFAVSFGKLSRYKHPLLDKKSQAKITQIIINRMDKDYLLPRGGAKREISDKKICVIGCGAIGGIVALELAKAGVLNLLLIDHDKFTKDNLYRHVLGIDDGIGCSKVDGLKKLIESKLPHNDVRAIFKRFDDVVRDEMIDFGEYNLIIDATGIPNVGFQIATYFVSQHQGLPVVHTWLEPLGIGGHVMVTNQKGRGCFKCLYRRTEEGVIYNGASFTAPGQSFSKSMFGCMGMFTPFSNLDAMKTACMVVDVTVKVLLGREDKNQLLSWKGDSVDILDQGFALSNRYANLTVAELYEKRYDFINDDCSLCIKKVS